MRIAQLAPLDEAVPPKRYGGTERVVSWLTEELVRRGHDVTLFASGDSHTAAQLVPVVARAARPQGDTASLTARILQLGMMARRADSFDVIHSHIDVFGFPALAQRPAVTTLHGRLDVDLYGPLLKTFATNPVISISDAQRVPAPDANWLATVYHGLPLDEYPFNAKPGDYFAFVGRISPEKRPHVAIELARRAGVRLLIAAKVDHVDREYYETLVKPRLHEPGIEFLGELGDREKVELMRNARALLFPILWPEPFGLVMIEALACGTPVITRRCGSTPEVIDHESTGFVCDSDEEVLRRIGALDSIARTRCREVAEARFSVTRMAEAYEKAYARVVRPESRQVRRASWQGVVPTVEPMD
jgi:glycosyltransferase involved in cell wall biosynthesis